MRRRLKLFERNSNKSRKNLFEPGIQLEDLSSRWELGYQRWLPKFGRTLIYGVTFFVAITAIEGATGTLARFSGRSWHHLFGRVSDNFRGQGALSYRALLEMVHLTDQKGVLQNLIIGDSVLTVGLHDQQSMKIDPVQDVFSAQLPGALNIAQACWEWGFMSLLIDKLRSEEAILRSKPRLIIDVNIKFFSYSLSYAPPATLEMALCNERSDNLLRDSSGGLSPKLDAICGQLKGQWPQALTRVVEFSPFLFNGLLGQFDFFMSFVQKSYIHEIGTPLRGLAPFRSLTPGLVDARRLITKFGENPQKLPSPFQPSNIEQQFMKMITDFYYWPDHPKHVWVDALAEASAKWPGSVVVILVGPQQTWLPYYEPLVRERIQYLEAEIATKFSSKGKPDLRFVKLSDILPDPSNFLDFDHLTPKGHLNLGTFL